jgi:hypothetical protein
MVSHGSCNFPPTRKEFKGRVSIKDVPYEHSFGEVLIDGGNHLGNLHWDIGTKSIFQLLGH